MLGLLHSADATRASASAASRPASAPLWHASRPHVRLGARAASPRQSATAAAQRHANDMLKTGVGGHIGSDGSLPQARITDAGYTRTGYTGEIVYWGTGSSLLRVQRSTRGWKVRHIERSS